MPKVRKANRDVIKRTIATMASPGRLRTGALSGDPSGLTKSYVAQNHADTARGIDADAATALQAYVLAFIVSPPPASVHNASNAFSEIASTSDFANCVRAMSGQNP